MIKNNCYIFFPFFLYAETHYSFRGIYSRFKKKEPEIIADAPHRVEPGQPIPIMFLIKDSDKFPAKISKIDIELSQGDNVILKKLFTINTEFVRQKYHSFILEINPPEEVNGLINIDVKFKISTNGRVKSYHNDNYRISSHDPLKVFIAKHPLPHNSNWYFGEIHYHSSYTEDQAEFGAPLESSIQLSRAMGVSFFAVSDHSYDLDDDEEDYLINDPHMRKWERLKQEANLLNKKYNDFVILPGEEVSAGNVRNRNVHFLIINNRDFIPGKGDSAEKWFKTKPDLTIAEILNTIDDKAVAIAAHPEVAAPFLQWLLIRRGKWQWQDYLHNRLDGIQIWNGISDGYFFKGVTRWIELLLCGKKMYIFAGNDAHGNFNRFRQIGFPFWTMKESNDQVFGKIRTGVKIESSLNLETIVRALKKGRCIITDGPFVEFRMWDENGSSANIGDVLRGKTFTIQIDARSTPEFGKLQQLTIYCGNISTKREIILQKYNRFDNDYLFTLNKDLTSIPKPGYIRLELISSLKDKRHRCLTNPIWLA